MAVFSIDAPINFIHFIPIYKSRGDIAAWKWLSFNVHALSLFFMEDN